jgi:hypothetical protein
MNTNDIFTPSWSTASFGDFAGTSSPELLALGAHLDQCKAPHGRVFALHCFAETLMGFVASRFVTTLALVALLMAVGSLVL